MTYCLAIRTSDGIVFAGDTLTNAGVDYVTSYRKLHFFDTPADRAFCLLSAGNLGITQEVCNTLTRDLEAQVAQSLASVSYGFEAAEYVGRTLRRVLERHAAAFGASGVSGKTTLILGGQIGEAPHEIYLIYHEGNYISASPETPYLQIGENKYGKPVLDRFATSALTLEDAARLSLVSLDATARSNLTVGAPYDLAIYRAGTLTMDRVHRFEAGTGFLHALSDGWEAGLARAFTALPRYDWFGDGARQ